MWRQNEKSKSFGLRWSHLSCPKLHIWSRILCFFYTPVKCEIDQLAQFISVWVQRLNILKILIKLNNYFNILKQSENCMKILGSTAIIKYFGLNFQLISKSLENLEKTKSVYFTAINLSKKRHSFMWIIIKLYST